MQDDPSGAALLDAAHRALIDEVVPGLTGRQRYVALMAARAIGIAAREITEGPSLRVSVDRLLAGKPAEELVRSIRTGGRDRDAELYSVLCEAVEVAVQVWKPTVDRL